ncbi:DUF6702 family protein [Spirosoma humi]
MLTKIVSGILLLSLMASRPAHDFHASVTQMQYNAKERAFEISIRIFTDDFEKTLAEASKSKVNLSGPGKQDPLIEKYVLSHFSYVNSQKQIKPIKYVGYEVETDAHWIYLEMPLAEPFRGGLLKQNVLMEMFDDQVNMVNVQYQGHKKTFVFRKNQPIQDISIE